MRNWTFRPQRVIPYKKWIRHSERQLRSQSAFSCRILFGVAVGIFLAGSLIYPRTANAQGPGNFLKAAQKTKLRGSVVRPKMLKAYGKLPVRFEANYGQTSRNVKFVSRGRGYALLLTDSDVVLALERGGEHSNPESQSPPLADGPFGDSSILAPFSLFSHIPQSNRKMGLEDESATARSAASVEAESPAVVHLKLIGANSHAKVSGLDELPGKSNYFVGNDPQKWLTSIPNYSRVRYQDIYPGVDLVYYEDPGKPGQLEYDFIVAPGADPASIKLSLEGAEDMSLDARGNLLIKVAGGEAHLRKPLVYQETAGQALSTLGKGIADGKRILNGRFQLGANNQVSFKVAAYDTSRPLIIDPVLSYATYLGGTNYDVGTRVAVDSSGAAYVTGITISADFPHTAGTVDGAIGSQSCYWGPSRRLIPCPDAFVTKLSPDGQTILYSTFLGGSKTDGATAIDVDGNGNVFLTGFTNSSDFPTTSGAFQEIAPSYSNVFVSKLNPTGSALIYSTFIGGTKDEIPLGIAIDSAGGAYITGFTRSSDFPTTTGSFQSALASPTCSDSLFFGSFVSSCPDAFVAKLNSTGTDLAYSTYLGGSQIDFATGIAVGSGGSAYVTGGTNSKDFPITSDAYQSINFGESCGPSSATHPCALSFVTELSPTGATLAYSTYFGGNGDTLATGIAVDDSASPYVTGFTNATDLGTGGAGQPFTVGVCGSTTNPFNCPDAFVAKFIPGGLYYLTYLGGMSYDFAMDIRVSGTGNAYVVGGTTSIDFPVTSSPIQRNFGGGSCSMDISGTTYSFYCPNAFLTVLDTTGSTLFSTFLGGAGGGIAFGVAVDPSGNAYLSGTTISSDFPVVNAIQPNLAGASEAFVAKISGLSAPTEAVTLAPSTLNFGSVNVGASSSSQTLTLSNSGSSSVSITNITITGTDSGDFAQTNTCGSSVAAGGSCTISVTFTPTTSGSRTAMLAVTDNASNSPQTAALTGTGQDFALTARTTSQTVAAGGTAGFDLLLSPKGGFNQEVSLSCSGAPQGATCKMEPATVTMDGTNDVAIQLKVTTTAASALGPGGWEDYAPPSGTFPLAAWLALLGLLGLVALVNLSAEEARIRRLVPLATLLLLVTLYAACGGGSSSTSSTTNPTPAGTSTLTVTASSGGLSHTSQVTLKVQ